MLHYYKAYEINENNNFQVFVKKFVEILTNIIENIRNFPLCF